MADTKITALSAITTVDPANDVLPIVDVSDTSMAASGTTKKITTNQILGASGTATLASATISGDLTVRTNKLAVTSTNVGIGTASPTLAAGVGLEIENAGIATLRLQNTSGANAFELQVDSDANGVLYRGYNNSPHVFYVNNSTAMTLNSTGLGVGGAPVNPLTVFAATSAKAPALLLSTAGSPTYGWDFSVDGAVNGNLFIRRLVAGTKTDVLEFDRANGNVGIGVTPSAWASIYKTVEFANGSSVWGQTDIPQLSLQTNAFLNSSFAWIYKTTAAASNYRQTAGEHLWFTAPSGTAGNVITFTERLRLKETGQLRFVPLASDPAGAEAGDVYYNSTSNKLKCYNGTTWNDLF